MPRMENYLVEVEKGVGKSNTPTHTRFYFNAAVAEGLEQEGWLVNWRPTDSQFLRCGYVRLKMPVSQGAYNRITQAAEAVAKELGLKTNLERVESWRKNR